MKMKARNEIMRQWQYINANKIAIISVKVSKENNEMKAAMKIKENGGNGGGMA
jgi:hypothetical protein